MKGREPERGPRSRVVGRAYQGALEAVFALAIMTLLGAFADNRFETTPVLTFIGLAIGFGSFTLRLVRLLKEVQAPPDDEGSS